MGQERNGQLYHLDIENDIQGEALRLREVHMARVDELEKYMSTLSENGGAEATEAISAHMFHQERAKKISAYCLSQGLIEDIGLAA